MSESQTTAELDYLIYAPAPGKGYTIRAKSAGVVEEAFLAAYKDTFCPYDELVFSDLQVEARVISKTSASGSLYFSRLYKRQRLDELGRDGIVCAVVSIPVQLLSQGLALKDVQNALIESERASPKVPIGDVPKLQVSWDSAEHSDLDTANMQSMVPQESATRLVSILSEGADSKAFVLYNAKYKDRNELCIALGKFLHRAGLEIFIVTSDCPMETFLGYYSNVVVSEYLPKLKPNSGWKIVNLGAAKSGNAGAKNLNETLKGVYG